MSWSTVKLSEILKRRRETIKIVPDQDYKLVTIRLYHKGVVLRTISKGADIRSTMSVVKAGDFILSGIDARNGAFGIVPAELDGAIVTNDFWCLDPDETLIGKEFLLFLTSTDFFDNICRQSSDGTTQRIRLQKDKFYNYEINLPPLKEQAIILKKLKATKSNTELISAELIHQLTLVRKLRQQLLQDAVQGKLVPQEKNDEPASELLKKIKAEKAKDKKYKELPPIKSEEIPFDIPDNWVWCRLGDLIRGTEGGKSPNCLNQPAEGEDWGVIKTTAIQELVFLQDQNKVLPKGFVVSEQHKVREGDLLITRAGPKNRVGIVCCVKNLTKRLILSDKTIRIRYIQDYLSPEYIALSLNSPLLKPIIEKKMTGMADSQVNISQDNIKEFSIPLPPLAEQHRIVETLEELKQTCDEMEASIQVSKGQNEQLLQQVLREALKPH